MCVSISGLLILFLQSVCLFLCQHLAVMLYCVVWCCVVWYVKVLGCVVCCGIVLPYFALPCPVIPCPWPFLFIALETESTLMHFLFMRQSLTKLPKLASNLIVLLLSLQQCWKYWSTSQHSVFCCFNYWNFIVHFEMR